ncbi:ankyrin repeat domain-containing protein [Sphingomicrobium aestuariivivum]|uniref:ankyrin repeat domain-containing protein n=1 Tax=Sphingomicrobium aestuariivivum TaxID=1582356 RepID=UPI001FD6D631|nr:ankyrin repeat domain-containing protein [Sphingomicrobium aestuariivivum]MCJ8190172.1 ankyrin repeat domain-containing protein [Sphingomicrobium aestuariivivum]
MFRFHQGRFGLRRTAAFLGAVLLAATLSPRAASAQSLVDMRTYTSDYFGLDPFDTQDAFDIACAAGEQKACSQADEMRGGKHFAPKKGYAALRSACRNDAARACLVQGWWQQMGLGTDADLEEAVPLFEQSCLGGDQVGCFQYLFFARTGEHWGVTKLDETAVRSRMQALCDAGFDPGCVGTTLYLSNEELGAPADVARHLQPLLSMCERNPGPCNFTNVINAVTPRTASPIATHLAAQAGPQARAGLERSIVRYIETMAEAEVSPVGALSMLRAMQQAGAPVVSDELLALANDDPDLLAVMLAGDSGVISDDAKRLALLTAANDGNATTIRSLLEAGANPDVRSNSDAGWTALQYAIVEGHQDAVDALLDGGADPSFASSQGISPLLSAAKRDRIDAINSLVEAGVDLWATVPETDFTALHMAASEGQTRAAALLLRAGADVDPQDSSKQTPLHYALGHEKLDTARLLIAQGADVDRPFPKTGLPLLTVAINGNNEEMAAMLLSAGASPNVEDNKGETPLFAAIRAENDPLAELLLDAGADAGHVSLSGETPSMLYAALTEKREAAAAAEAERQRREAEARRRAEQQRIAEQQNKKRDGLLGGLIGAVAGAAIGTEMGLGAEQVGQLASTLGQVGMHAEQGEADSFQKAQRAVSSLEGRLAMTAPTNPDAQANASRLYAEQMREAARQGGDPVAMALTESALEAGQKIGQAMADQREFENEMARMQAEMAQQQAAARAPSPSNAAATTSTARQRQEARRQEQVARRRTNTQAPRQMTLKVNMPTLSNCTTMEKDDPYDVVQYGDCANRSGANGNGDNAGGNGGDGSGAPRYADNGHGNDTGDNGGEGSNGNGNGGDNGGLTPVEGRVETHVRGSQPPLTWEEHAEMQERYGCYKPAAGCVVLVETVYDSRSGMMKFKFRNDCSGVIYYRYSLPKKDGGLDEGSWTVQPGRPFEFYSYAGDELMWQRHFAEFIGSKSSTGSMCRNEIFRTDVGGVAYAKKTRR